MTAFTVEIKRTEVDTFHRGDTVEIKRTEEDTFHPGDTENRRGHLSPRRYREQKLTAFTAEIKRTEVDSFHRGDKENRS